LTIEKLLKLIGQVLFSIVIASHQLLQTNGKIEKLKYAIKLKNAITNLKNSIDLLKEELIIRE